MQILTNPLTINAHGFSTTVFDKDYVGAAFRMMDKMWKVVRSNELKNKGLNVIVYGHDHNVFAGVELVDAPGDSGLELKPIVLAKYAYHKHVGPYNLIKQAGQKMRDDLNDMGFETTMPYIEIYGHWNKDESKLETELLMALK